MTSIRFNTAKTALKARVHDSSASVLLGPEPDPPPLTLPTSPIDDMPMLAESLIECPAILSLWILCEHQQGIIRWSMLAGLLDSTSGPSTPVRFAKGDQLAETVQHADERVVESSVLQEPCRGKVCRGEAVEA